jgi:hypothetical protein
MVAVGKKRQQLLKVDLPDFLAIEILGPSPPERVSRYAPTSARLTVKAPADMEAQATQNQQNSL